MRDTLYPLRKAFYEALNGQLTYNSVDVPVYDEIAPNNAPSSFVIISTGTTVDNDTLTSFQSENTLLIDIVSKTGVSVSKDVVDNIANQVFLILKPSPNTNGLIPQAGFTFSQPKVASDNHLSLVANETTTRRLIRFSIKINQ